MSIGNSFGFDKWAVRNGYLVVVVGWYSGNLEVVVGWRATAFYVRSESTVTYEGKSGVGLERDRERVR